MIQWQYLLPPRCPTRPDLYSPILPRSFFDHHLEQAALFRGGLLEEQREFPASLHEITAR